MQDLEKLVKRHPDIFKTVPVEKNSSAEIYEKKVKPHKQIEGFVLVPELNLNVAEHILRIDDRIRAAAENVMDLTLEKVMELTIKEGYLADLTWYQAKELLSLLGSRMLTPTEFWKFYDYCLERRPEIIEKSFFYSEWLDGIIKDKKYLITNSCEQEIDIEQEDFWFDRQHINEKTGLPSKRTDIENKGRWKWQFFPAGEMETRYLCRSLYTIEIIRADYTASTLGVREVRD